ncbi:membrane fusion protein, multidrug efflux system [Pseudidiomarina planktonica]|uniref:Membrane fusion protein, multidrug efflux system n=1 Tax=Pseudidiomarina planktonica TaxID=1323738 RepID=A0A1Y6ERF2_9GAMM|nr:efflux RND transporter periplasmic adaptor subunit [Pseudidiomarina planktonica]RUO65458.1 efflux RND transporter periplasmic adaptor subunit [Pseudidiomarina planktonica]SMQ64906.1 membrane fusion protein, multidrug efflux system [Pseudidiomarina planktonica]
MQQRPSSSLFVSVLAGSLLLAACSDEAPADSGNQQEPMTVGVVTIEPQSVTLTTSLPGRAAAYKVAEVRPQVSGIIEQQLFEGGAMVEAGQQLYQIEDSTYAAELNSAEAALARAQANLSATEKRFQRFENLIEESAVSQQDFDEVEATYLQAQAELKVAQADVARAELNIQYTQVRAPISGRIGRSLLTEGALVSNGQAQALTTIHQLDPIYIDIVQSSDEYLQLQQDIRSGRIETAPDNRAEVAVLVGNNESFRVTGELLFNEVSVDPQTSAITLRARVDNPDHRIMPGMYVNTEVTSGTLKQALLAPQSGVTRDPRGRAMVMLVNSDGKVEQRFVEVASTLGSDWIVTDGLEAGDQVIVEGLQKISPDMPVKTEEVK